MVKTVLAITLKGHSHFITLRQDAMRDLGWRRGDRLVAVQWADVLVLRKLNLGEAADTIAGMMLRRERGDDKEIIAGEWQKRRDKPEPEP
jgi:hypothetical protein